MFFEIPQVEYSTSEPNKPNKLGEKRTRRGDFSSRVFLGVFEGVKCSSFQVPENTENSARKVYVAGGSVAQKGSDAVYDFYTKIVPR